MKLSVSTLLLLAAQSASALDAILYNEEQSNCIIKVEGGASTFGDYEVNNNKVNPGLICINGICNVGQHSGAIGLPMTEGTDDMDEPTFTERVKFECPDKGDDLRFKFSCPRFRDRATMSVISCATASGKICTVTQKTSGGTIEVDQREKEEESTVLYVKFTCTTPF